jgi:hypothetical protein
MPSEGSVVGPGRDHRPSPTSRWSLRPLSAAGTEFALLQEDGGNRSTSVPQAVVMSCGSCGRSPAQGRCGGRAGAALGESALGLLTPAELMLVFVDGEDGLEPAIPGSSTDPYIFRSSRYLRYNTATHRITNVPKPDMTSRAWSERAAVTSPTTMRWRGRGRTWRQRRLPRPPVRGPISSLGGYGHAPP